MLVGCWWGGEGRGGVLCPSQLYFPHVQHCVRVECVSLARPQTNSLHFNVACRPIPSVSMLHAEKREGLGSRCHVICATCQDYIDKAINVCLGCTSHSWFYLPGPSVCYSESRNEPGDKATIYMYDMKLLPLGFCVCPLWW